MMLTNNSSTCIFCKIVSKESPSYLIYENEELMVLLDIFPYSKGHLLVISKQHVESFLTFPSNLLGNFFQKVQQMSQHIVKILNAKGINILTNVGAIASQSVFHFHVHIIPKYENNEGLLIEKNIAQSFSTKELETICAKLKISN
jgi:histidine triad (HIT) family protein